MLAYLYNSGSHADFNTHVATVRGRLTLTAAFSGTQAQNVAFWLKSLPTHALDTVVKCIVNKCSVHRVPQQYSTCTVEQSN